VLDSAKTKIKPIATINFFIAKPMGKVSILIKKATSNSLLFRIIFKVFHAKDYFI